MSSTINGGKPIQPNQTGIVITPNDANSRYSATAGKVTAMTNTDGYPFTITSWVRGNDYTEDQIICDAPSNLPEQSNYTLVITNDGEQEPFIFGDNKADTFADLRTIEPVIDYQTIELIGNTVAGVGGGTFYALLDGSSYADDGIRAAKTSGGAVWLKKSEDAQKKKINRIVTFGDSITWQSFSNGTAAAYAQRDLSKYGFSNVRLDNVAVSGHRSFQVLDEIEAVISAAPSNDKILFVGMTGTNDIWSTRPFSSASEASKYFLGFYISLIIKTVKDAGYDIILSDIAYADFNDTVPTEADGSKPYNDKIINQVISLRLPEYFDFGARRPKLSLYNTFNDNKALLEADGVHPNADGEQAIRDAYLGIASQYFESESSRYKPNSGERIIIDFKEGGALNSNKAFYTVDAATDTFYKPTSTFGIDFLNVVADSFTASNVSGYTPTGDTTVSLTADSLLYDFVFISSGEKKFNFSNIEPNTTAKLRMTSTYAGAGVTIGEWEYNGVIQTLDASAATPEIIEFDVTFDSNGQIDFTTRVPSGSDYSILCGIELEFD